MTKEIDCENTHEIVCPYCGYEHTDSDAMVDDDYYTSQKIKCERCEKKFMVETIKTTQYYSAKADCLNGTADHDWDDWYRPLPRGFQYRRCKVCNQKESREVPQ